MSMAGEINKFAGAILGAATLAMGLSLFSGVLVNPKKPEKAGYDLPSGEAAKPAAGGGAAAAAEEPIAKRLASADAKRGEGLVKQCNACHTFDKGGAVKTGPNLFGIVDRKAGSVAGFNYSDALKGLGKGWDYEQLDKFLTNPKTAAPGNKMSFAGIAKPDQRADLIAYLNSLADSPKPLPK